MIPVPKEEYNELSMAYMDYTLEKIAYLGALLECTAPDANASSHEEQRYRPCFGKEEAHIIKQKILALVDTL